MSCQHGQPTNLLQYIFGLGDAWKYHYGHFRWGQRMGTIRVDEDRRRCDLCGRTEKEEYQTLDFGDERYLYRTTGRWIPVDQEQPKA